MSGSEHAGHIYTQDQGGTFQAVLATRHLDKSIAVNPSGGNAGMARSDEVCAKNKMIRTSTVQKRIRIYFGRFSTRYPLTISTMG
jgi:hypothetical protein